MVLFFFPLKLLQKSFFLAGEVLEGGLKGGDGGAEVFAVEGGVLKVLFGL